jgi:pimeloyl-ACP methyl ester carboxylesterase
MQRILDDCDADPACGGAFPSLRREWGDVLEMLDTGAVVAQYADSTGTRGVALQRGPFCEALRQMLVATSMQRMIPRMIHEAATGNFQPFLEAAMRGGFGGADGMYLCVTCPEGTTRITDAEIDAVTGGTFLGRYRVDRQVAACRIWGLPPAPEEDLRPVSGTVPTLFMTGSMDYVTPVDWAQEISSRLTNSLVLVVDDLGHRPEGLDNLSCYDEVIDRFFRSGSVIGLDTACLDSMPPPPFIVE